ncbi:ankyrin repeat domain-containing protein [Fusarium austroafricanum]|uniref:Ankyrin repeat domain-containing protein n=1 Tax=Fusarium austroafricanum TaxID=2364996 RepID=A0A8H4KMB8_9HYPO|nr:ankyrin repeat domain-containing protein [Fusarium austroafricanum]
MEEDCLQSLSFSRLGYRQRSIQRVFNGTCTWLFEQDKYKAWINRDDVEKHLGLLRIIGGVGTGKSTLMNEAYLAAQQVPNKDNKRIIAGYFAYRGVEPMERSTGGMIRTLLLQILPKHKIMMDDLVSIYNTRSSQQGTTWQWTAEELFAFMEKHLIKSGGTAFYIFIDGLDEFVEDEARHLVLYFRKLTITGSAIGANINVSLSSRYYPSISAPLCPEITVETEN